MLYVGSKRSFARGYVISTGGRDLVHLESLPKQKIPRYARNDRRIFLIILPKIFRVRRLNSRFQLQVIFVETNLRPGPQGANIGAVFLVAVRIG